jgi:hypothetical protein
MAAKGPVISTQGTAGNRKHVTLSPQKLEAIVGLKVAKDEVWLWLYKTFVCDM